MRAGASSQENRRNWSIAYASVTSILAWLVDITRVCALKSCMQRPVGSAHENQTLPDTALLHFCKPHDETWSLGLDCKLVLDQTQQV